MQDEFDKPKIEQKGVPGPRLVAWLLGSVIFFPLLCVAVLIYARRVGQAEGARFGYSAVRDPNAWLFIILVLVACGVFGWWMGQREKRKNNEK